MSLIYETQNFTVDAEESPLVDRDDGGHITINPKIKVSNRQELAPRLAIELMRLTIVVGEAMESALRSNGVDIGRINYQDNGNWSVFLPEGPTLHIHLFGRSKNAKVQTYGEALHFPHRKSNPQFYENCRPLNRHDISLIKDKIIFISNELRFSDDLWKL